MVNWSPTQNKSTTDLWPVFSSAGRIAEKPDHRRNVSVVEPLGKNGSAVMFVPDGVDDHLLGYELTLPNQPESLGHVQTLAAANDETWMVEPIEEAGGNLDHLLAVRQVHERKQVG